MALGTLFGTIHSDSLGLLQESVTVHPAKPNLEIIPIGGADGAVDISDEPAGWVTFDQREIDWVFSVKDGPDWPTVRTRVANAINGLRCHITLDEDPDYYYDGRITVNDFKLDAGLQRITVTAKCQPYKLKQTGIAIEKDIPAQPNYAEFILENSGRRPEVPTLWCNKDAIVDSFYPTEVSFVVKSNAYTRNPDLVLPPGQSARIVVSGVKEPAIFRLSYEEAQQ